MHENVLILTGVNSLGARLRQALKDGWVEEITWCKRSSELVFEKGWFEKFTTIVIGEIFCDNGRETAALVRKIRKEYFNPMIGIHDIFTGEGLFPLQVAGCNFPIHSVAGSSDEAEREIVRAVKKDVYQIAGELGRDHHHRRTA